MNAVKINFENLMGAFLLGQTDLGAGRHSPDQDHLCAHGLDWGPVQVRFVFSEKQECMMEAYKKVYHPI